ncbi:adenosine receptor A3-like [Dreissena polymorpha]|uniref:adenosine receptor A3-like n=1 Tax=Dreissena polymorpha TaxID=45954 RepID=UPI002263EC80|nr:adenosine receptor A3-like [Dreissena polymorpha]
MFSMPSSLRNLILEFTSMSEQTNDTSMPPTNEPTTLPKNMESLIKEDTLFTTLHGYEVTIGILVIAIVMAIIGTVIILLNAVLLRTLVKCRSRLEVTDLLIKGLAVTDLMIGVLLMYNTVYNIVNFQNRYECLLRIGMIHAMLLNSTGHISLLTVNRYVKVLKPLHYKQIFKKWRVVLLSGFVWFFSILFGFLPLFGWNLNYVPKSASDDTVCRYFAVVPPGYMIMNVSLFWIPLILMAIMYSHLCKITLRHQKEISSQHRSLQTIPCMPLESSSWRFTKTVLTVIGAYFFCWLPAGTFFIIQVSGTVNSLSYDSQGNILVFTTAFGFLNSILNPLIYATKIPCVKAQFKQTFCCKKPDRRASWHSFIYDIESNISIANRRRVSNDCERL